MQVLGIKRISYDRKSDGAHVEGVEIHYSYPAKNIQGVGVEKVFISQSVLDQEGCIPAPGDNIDLMYNRWGRVSGFNLL